MKTNHRSPRKYRSFIEKVFIYIFLISFSALSLTSCDDDESDDLDENKDSEESLDNIVPEDFLKSSNYDQLEVEILYVDGFKPTTQALDSLKDLLNSHLNKPEGIFFTFNSIDSPSDNSYTLSELKNIEEENRSVFPENNNLGAYIFFADKKYEDENVLGLAYNTTSMAIFEKTITEHSGGVSEPPRYKLEATVMNHEFGHTIGLVNNGTDMVNDHQDEAHGKHCDVEDCLLYYATSTTDVIDNLFNSSIPSLDSQCQDDLEANGGK